jgi:hypothetical protein
MGMESVVATTGNCPKFLKRSFYKDCRDLLPGESLMSMFCTIDDKYVPLYRIMWVASVPHFCGEEDCMAEGKYEIRLEQGDAVWANVEERDSAMSALERWQGGLETPGEEWEP